MNPTDRGAADAMASQETGRRVSTPAPAARRRTWPATRPAPRRP